MRSLLVYLDNHPIKPSGMKREYGLLDSEIERLKQEHDADFVFAGACPNDLDVLLYRFETRREKK